MDRLMANSIAEVNYNRIFLAFHAGLVFLIHSVYHSGLFKGRDDL